MPAPVLRSTSAPPKFPAMSTFQEIRTTMRIESLLNPVEDDAYRYRPDLAAQDTALKVRNEAALTLLGLASSPPGKPINPLPHHSHRLALTALPDIAAIAPPPKVVVAPTPPPLGMPAMRSSPPHSAWPSSTGAEAGDSSSEFAPSQSTTSGDMPLSEAHTDNLTVPNAESPTPHTSRNDDDLFLTASDDIDDVDNADDNDGNNRMSPFPTPIPSPFRSSTNTAPLTVKEGDLANREFSCWVMGDKCNTGQYTLNLSRKMVSDYFGRNKTGTKKVESGRWIRACRKHYQRKSYQDQWRWHKGNVVIQQLRMIAAQQQQQQQPRPARFKVSLKSSEARRLSDYKQKLVDERRLFDRTAPEVNRVDDADGAEAGQAPLAVLQDIADFVRTHGGGDDAAGGCLDAEACEKLVGRAVEWVKAERCRRLPLFEMMPVFAEEVKREEKKEEAGKLAAREKVAKTPSPNKAGGAAAGGKKRKRGGGSGGSGAAKRVKA
ncbi:hypothetical protein BK809_0005602 [Diplodia seriata]|uniref:Uncharacterized protein n=1 Tax=Diplodia seriata TaxID=420778 RepID=A0A1S8BN03_9PEZI|nr:hypothetical protein BK809_0005602 [Diplodia seriata]